MTMRTIAFAAVALAAWLAPTTGNASPINYNITISGGIKDCGSYGPLNVPCDAVTIGSILVDSEGTTFAEQVLAFTLQAAPQLTLTLHDTRWAGANNTVEFDSSGALVGFKLPLIFYRLDPPAGADPLTAYAVHMAFDANGGSFKFEGRYDSRMYNACTGCVAISVSEPGASWLLIPAIALTFIVGRRRRLLPT
jgi:hypothetical protein